MHDLILSCDIGTTSLKMALVTLGGEVVSHFTVYFENPGDSFIALQWEKAFYKAAKVLLPKGDSSDALGMTRAENTSSVILSDNTVILSEVEGSPLCAISISGNGPTVCTENGRTFRWNETNLSEAQELGGENCRKSLFAPKLLSFFTKYKTDLDKSRWLLSGPEWLVYKLTGSAVTLLPEARYKTAYWNDGVVSELKSAGFPVEKLPPYVLPAQKMGKLLPSVKTQLGISENLPVFGAGPDFIAAMIGTNTLKPGVLYDCAGSSEGINFCIENPVFKEGLRTLPSVRTGLWNVAALSVESGRRFMECARKNNSGALEGDLSGEVYRRFFDESFSDKNSEGFGLINEILKQVKSGIENLKAFALENKLDFPKRIVVCGGQAKNEKWMQARSDYLGLEIAVTNHPDAELIGDAVVAFTGLGHFSSVSEAAEKIVKVTRVYVPKK